MQGQMQVAAGTGAGPNSAGGCTSTHALAGEQGLAPCALQQNEGCQEIQTQIAEAVHAGSSMGKERKED
eukprot:515014-Pelagomonas_calceolata.AAC.5